MVTVSTLDICPTTCPSENATLCRGSTGQPLAPRLLLLLPLRTPLGPVAQLLRLQQGGGASSLPVGAVAASVAVVVLAALAARKYSAAWRFVWCFGTSMGYLPASFPYMTLHSTLIAAT